MIEFMKTIYKKTTKLELLVLLQLANEHYSLTQIKNLNSDTE